jgi:hypothetical protein
LDFVTDPERMQCARDDALILIHEKKISNLKLPRDPMVRRHES